jgi:YD repeat-containing protein
MKPFRNTLSLALRTRALASSKHNQGRLSRRYSNGNLTSVVTPSGQAVSYGYSNRRISSVTLNGSTTILSGVIHDPFGPIAGWTWGNSTLAARAYDD